MGYVENLRLGASIPGGQTKSMDSFSLALPTVVGVAPSTDPAASASSQLLGDWEITPDELNGRLNRDQSAALAEGFIAVSRPWSQGYGNDHSPLHEGPRSFF